MTSNLILPSGAAWTLVEVRYNDSAALQHYAFVYDGAGTLTTYTNKVGDGGVAHTPSVTDYLITETVYNTAVTSTNHKAYTYDDTAFNQTEVDDDYALYIAGGTSYTGSATLDISGSTVATSILSNTGSATLDISGATNASSKVSNTGAAILDISGLTATTSKVSNVGSATLGISGNTTATSAMSLKGLATLGISGSTNISSFVSNTGSAILNISGSTVASSILSNTGSGTLDISGLTRVTSSTDDQAIKAIYTTTIEDVPKYPVEITDVPKYPIKITDVPKYTIEITYGGETMNYDRGSIPILRATVKKAVKFGEGALFDPTTVTVTVTDPSGVKKVTTATMTKDTTGKYYYYLQTAKDWESGLYKVDVDITDSGDADVTVDESLYLKE
jgi:hypothetical protein